MRLFLPLLPALLVVGTAMAQQVSVDSFEHAVSVPGTQLLDVRTAREFNTGFLPGTLQADWNNPKEFAERARALDPQRPVYVYCLSGVRSAAAMNWLQEQGYTAIALAGGLNAWKKQGLPVANQQPVQQLTEADYRQLTVSGKTVLVDVSASWCPPCRVMTPRIDSLAAAHKTITLVRIDGAEQSDLVRLLDIDAFPTLLLYRDGKLAWRKAGLTDAAEIARQF